MGRAMQGALALLLTVLTVRVMVPAQYGVYIVILGLVDLIRPLSSLGVLPTVQQFLPEMALHATQAQLRGFLAWSKIFRWVLLLGLAIALYFCWGWVANFAAIPAGPGTEPTIVCAMVCVVLALEYSEATLEALLEQKHAQGVRLLHTGIRLLGVVAIALLGMASAAALLWLELVAATIALVISEALLRKRVGLLRPDGSKSFSRGELVRFGAHLTISQVLSSLATPGTVRIIVSRMLGIEAAGQFGFIQTLMNQLARLLPSLLLMNLIRPTLIVARVRGNSQLVAEACGLLFKSNVVLVWPLVPAVLIVGDTLLAWLSGGRVLGAGLSMTCLLVALVGFTQIQVSSIVLQVHRMSGYLAWLGILSLLAPLFVWLGARYSLVLACLGMAIATILRSSLTNLVIHYSQARVRFDWYGTFRFLLALAVALAAGYIASQRLSGFGWGAWAGLALFTLVIVSLLPLCRPFAMFEARVLLNVLGNRVAVINRFTHAH